MQICNSLQPKHMFMNMWILRANQKLFQIFLSLVYMVYSYFDFYVTLKFSVLFLLLKHAYQKQQINFLISYL